MSDPVARLTVALEGHYVIETELGEGGMATVYLARDLKHNRQVALKVLKPELSAVVGSERFLTEIETTANLQHPHILPLFDSGEADGFLFYVMPYVEGETLRERLEREKQLSIEEGVRIGKAVAGALDYAHRHGVVHRDIKPANILIHDGQPVVSDFGIALAVGAGGGSRLTETGLSVGSPYYMSPEQATGDQQVGPASDIYSLGCVVYEMLVGEPPFLGNTAQAVLGKIIQGGPVSATSMRKSVPPHIDATIRKALEKLPADRFVSAQDFARALENPSFRHGTGVGTVGADGRWKGAAVGLAAVSVLLLGGLLWSVFGGQEISPRVERYASPFLADQEPGGLGPPFFGLAPDGSFLVYRSGGVLWVRKWEDLDATQIRGSTAGWTPSVSPDGAAVSFWRGDTREIYVASLGGGPVQTLLSEAGAWQHWGRDGFIYARAGETQMAVRQLSDQRLVDHIVRVSGDGGAVDTLWSEPKGESHYVRGITAKGDRALISVSFTEDADAFPQVRLVDLQTGEGTSLVEGAWPRLLPTGHVAYVAPDSSLMVAPLDADRGELAGAPVALVEGIVAFDVAGDGSLFYTTGDPAITEVELVWVTRTGTVTPVQAGWTFDPDVDNRSWRLSPDGTKVALKARTDLGNDIWVKELPEGPLTRLTFHEAPERMPRWHPNGELVSFISGRDGQFMTYTRRADGVGDATPIPGTEDMADHTWSPDGNWLVMRVTGPSGAAGGRDIMVLRPSEDTVPTPLLDSEYDEFSPAVSPDGRWIAYASDETGRREVFVRPFPEVNRAKVQISDGGGRGPVWAPDGDELFYITDGPTVGEGRSLIVAELRPGPPMAVIERRPLFELPDDMYFANFTTSVDVTPDGERFLMARVASRSDPNRRRFVLVRNWFQEFEGRFR